MTADNASGVGMPRSERQVWNADSQQVVPRLMRGTLYGLLLIAGALSVPSIGDYGPLPTTALLDAWLIAFMLVCVFRGRTHANVALMLLAGYLLTRAVPVVLTDSPLIDALQAYRWVLYLMAIALAVGRSWGPVQPLVRVVWALLIMAAIKSGLTLLMLGPGERPGLLLENNFELALFSGLVGVLYAHLEKQRLPLLILLGAVVALSGSRSGTVAFVALALYAASQAQRAGLFARYLMVLGLLVVGALTFWLFEQRAAAVTRIDRLNFLQVFLDETSDWTVLTWMFGTTPITPLSANACDQLSYYYLLFSSEGDGTCYSVILHAFVLRVVYDAGLVGLLLSTVVPWVLMRRSGVQRSLSIALLAIAIANGLSVSGMNNPYVALPILIAVLTATGAPALARRHDPVERGDPLTRNRGFGRGG